MSLLQYDVDNKIVDVFVRRDPNCPYPFHKDDWYHEGFDLEDFVALVQDMFINNKLKFRIVAI